MVEARIPDLMKETCGSNYSANGVMNVLFQVCHSFFGRLLTNYCHYISLSLSQSSQSFIMSYVRPPTKSLNSVPIKE